MKSRSLHVLALVAVSFVACKTGGGTAPGGASGSSAGSVSMDPGTKVAEIDGKAITYGELSSDKDVGPKVKSAETKAMADLYDARRSAVDELITRRLLEDQAKAKNETLDQWLQNDYSKTVPDPTDADVKAFFEEHKAQLPPDAKFEDFKDRLKPYVKQQKLRDNMGKLLEDLRAKHKVQVALQPPRMQVEAKGPSRGPSDAKVTIVEFSDFQCPFCGREVPVVEKVMKDYDGKVRLVFRNFPLENIHPNAAKAAEAGACAADQNKFWPMHDKMFANQQKLSVDDLKGYAKELGLDTKKFDQCLDSGEKRPQIDADLKAGGDAGVQGTPAFFINGVFINGAQPYEQFKQTIDHELSGNKS